MRFDDGRPRGAFLVGVPGARVKGCAVGEKGRHGAHDLRRLVETPQELSDVHPARRLEILPAAVDEDEAGAAVGQGDRGPSRHDGPEAVPGEHDAVVATGQQPGTLGCGNDIVGKRPWVIAFRRRIRQAVAAQIHRDDRVNSHEPARDRRPGPGRVRQAVNEEHAGPAAAAPIEKVDTVACPDRDDVAFGRGSSIQRQHGVHDP